MKKLLLIMCILLVIGGCTQDYKDIKPKEPISGTKMVIDSAEWTSVLVQIHSEYMLIYNSDKSIKRIEFWDPGAIAALGMLIAFCICILIIIAVKTE